VAPVPQTLWIPAGIAHAKQRLRARWCRHGQSPLALADALFPLNHARGYFAGFGRRGLVEAQWLVPHARFEAFAATLADAVGRHRPRITLVASKLFAGEASGLRFDGEGVALAIQLADPDGAPQRAFLEALAELAIAHGGRPNPIKDSTLDAATMRRAIPAFDAARQRLAQHNHGALHASELARRLAL
jgi:decaprenylphospho-beta-D-ribofuranose 2-oxidase